MTLSDFLLARIAEDEDKARREVGRFDVMLLGPFDPARVLAECEAKRRIVEEHSTQGWAGLLVCRTCAYRDEMGDPVTGDGDRDYCPTLRALALPFADHPDYRAEEWAP